MCAPRARARLRSDMPNRALAAQSSCACAAALLQPRVLPTLQTRGAHPGWDDYLSAVYGAGVQYPVVLSDLAWFYRCDCHVTDRWCNRSAALCAALELPHSGAWRRNCLPLPDQHERVASSAAASGGRLPVPKVWMEPDQPSCRTPFREAFVGLHLASHVRRNPTWRGWPNPEVRLAPYGVWLYPRPVPTCLANHTWVEVIRIREPYESQRPLTWYYHAPGSGIWLNTGRSTCVANTQRDARQFEPAHVADAASLEARGFRAGVGVDARLKSARARLAVDTMQRNGPFGNMLEIVDVRPEATQRCGRDGCTCSSTLRAGWAASRECRCSESASVLLNCRG